MCAYMPTYSFIEHLLYTLFLGAWGHPCTKQSLSLCSLYSSGGIQIINNEPKKQLKYSLLESDKCYPHMLSRVKKIKNSSLFGYNF